LSGYKVKDRMGEDVGLVRRLSELRTLHHFNLLNLWGPSELHLSAAVDSTCYLTASIALFGHFKALVVYVRSFTAFPKYIEG